jgi:hypothetical protein
MGVTGATLLTTGDFFLAGFFLTAFFTAFTADVFLTDTLALAEGLVAFFNLVGLVLLAFFFTDFGLGAARFALATGSFFALVFLLFFFAMIITLLAV